MQLTDYPMVNTLNIVFGILVTFILVFCAKSKPIWIRLLIFVTGLVAPMCFYFGNASNSGLANTGMVILIVYTTAWPLTLISDKRKSSKPGT